MNSAQQKVGWKYRLQRVVRLVRNPHLRAYELRNFAWYWHTRKRVRSLAFRFRRFNFGIAEKYRSFDESASILAELLRTTLPKMFLAFAIVLALALLQDFARDHSRGLIQPLLTDEQTNAFKDLLEILAQVAGVFLALYFTSVSVVASTAYARVQGSIRDLVMRDKVGNFYTSIIVLLTGVSVFLLIKNALSFPLGLFDLYITALLAALAIFSFIPLGLRIFRFFDPTTLVQLIARDMVKSARAATPKGPDWKDYSFQAHYQRRFSTLLDTYRDVIHIAAQEEHLRTTPLTGAAIDGLRVLMVYSKNKLSIPSDSHWFRRTARHRSWLTSASGDEISLALRSGTPLRPELVPDLTWIEDEIREILGHVLKVLLEKKDWSDAIELGEAIQLTLSELVSNLAVDEALGLLERIQAEVRKALLDLDSEIPNYSPKELRFVLGLIDVWNMGLPTITAKLTECLREIDAKWVESLARRVSWNKDHSIYGNVIPRPVLERIEFLQKRLDFEYQVEGEFISPAWYQQQLIAASLAKFVVDAAELLVARLKASFLGQVEDLISRKQHTLAAQVIQRGIESCDKLLIHLTEAGQCCARIAELRREPDIPWTNEHWGDLQATVVGTREKLVAYYGSSALFLARLPRNGEWPDYFGQCLSILAAESYSALVADKEDAFDKTFPHLFMASLAAYDRLSEDLKGRQDQAALAFMMEPIKDLLQISGYAFIYSELTGRKYRETVIGVWDKYLGNSKEPRSRIAFLLARVEFRDSVDGIFPRDLIRTEWGMELDKRLRREGLVEDELPFLRFRRSLLKTKSPSAMLLALSGGSMSYQAHAVFIVSYLQHRSEAGALPLPRHAKEFEEILKARQEYIAGVKERGEEYEEA